MVACDGGANLIKARRLRPEGPSRPYDPASTSPPKRWDSDGHDDGARGRLAVGAPLAKAKKRDESTSRAARPHVTRSELVDKAVRARFEEEIDAALKRRSAGEAKLAGALRAVAPLSSALRASLGEATAVLLRRGTRQRELYACGLRALAEAQDRQSVGLLRQALAGDEAGGSPALSAACFSRDPELSPLLAKVAASRQSHLAFGAELARVARGESNGALLAQLAPMIKESHRISMCIELFVPLLRAPPVAGKIGPALSVLRGAERHLGRWLVLAEVAVKAGDTSPLEEACAKAVAGPSSSRAAWSLVAWALSDADAAARGAAPPPPPTTRPTLELVARLSDRPSADRDTTFLFRMARARAPAVRPMLETIARGSGQDDETTLRAWLYLARDHGRDDLRASLVEASTGGRREELRGMAAAALWDVSAPGADGPGAKARAPTPDVVEALMESRIAGNVAWGALIRAASKGAPGLDPLLTETPFRWIQWGWIE
jgi:hypothetical protein